MNTTTLTRCLNDGCEREVGPHHAFCCWCKQTKLDTALDMRLNTMRRGSKCADWMAAVDRQIARVIANDRNDWSERMMSA